MSMAYGAATTNHAAKALTALKVAPPIDDIRRAMTFVSHRLSKDPFESIDSDIA